jgi:hypothetical protein
LNASLYCGPRTSTFIPWRGSDRRDHPGHATTILTPGVLLEVNDRPARRLTSPSSRHR